MSLLCVSCGKSLHLLWDLTSPPVKWGQHPSSQGCCKDACEHVSKGQGTQEGLTTHHFALFWMVCMLCICSQGRWVTWVFLFLTDTQGPTLSWFHTHLSFAYLLSPWHLPLHNSPGPCPWQQRDLSRLGPNREETMGSTRTAAGRCPVRPASSLSALRPDMKGLLREIWGTVIRAFLLWIMVLPQPED